MSAVLTSVPSCGAAQRRNWNSCTLAILRAAQYLKRRPWKYLIDYFFPKTLKICWFQQCSHAPGMQSPAIQGHTRVLTCHIACRGHYADKGTFFSVPLRLPGSTILPKKGLSALSFTMQKSVTRYSTKERAKFSDCQQKYLRDQDVREYWWSFDRTFRILQNLRK